MTEQQLEEIIQADFDTLAYKLGADILGGLAENYPREFSTWMSDMRFGSAARYALGFQAKLTTVDEAKADVILSADTLSEGGH